MQLNVNNNETQVTRKPPLLSGLRKDKKGQTTGLNILIQVIVARSGLPAEFFLAFIFVVCIVAGFYTVLFFCFMSFLF